MLERGSAQSLKKKNLLSYTNYSILVSQLVMLNIDRPSFVAFSKPPPVVYYYYY